MLMFASRMFVPPSKWIAGLPPIAFGTSVGCFSAVSATAFTVEPSTAHADTLPPAPAVTPESARNQSSRPVVGTAAFVAFTSAGGTEIVVVVGAGWAAGAGGGALDVVTGASAGLRQAVRTSRTAAIAIRFMVIS